MKTCITAIQKNEPNLEEWLDWHSILTDHIFIFCHDCWPSYDIFKKYENKNVTFLYLKDIEDIAIQLGVYTFFCNSEISSEYDFTLFIDLDEYLILKNKTYQNSLNTVLKDFQKDLVVGFNWFYYGSHENEKFTGDYSKLLCRFQHMAPECCFILKSCLNLNLIRKSGHKVEFLNPHWPTLIKDGKKIWPKVKCFNGKYATHPDTSMPNGCPDPEKFPYLAHFYSKTENEFKMKIMRGRPDWPSNSVLQYYNMEKKMLNKRLECDPDSLFFKNNI